MESEFSDIKIVSLEEEMTVESPSNPALRYVYFRLSQTPIPLWKSTFEKSRKISRHPHWRRAWLDRKYIVIECLPDEIEKYHLNDLKQDIAQANRACHDYFQSRASSPSHKTAITPEERDQLRDLKGRLNFD
ncbi:MAG: hypothetical protein LV479_05730 [Methylacidiphilales bacterium]|nr:hypothetical protein [Candidatus Methylacidiphilales bacterium]